MDKSEAMLDKSVIDWHLPPGRNEQVPVFLMTGLMPEPRNDIPMHSHAYWEIQFYFHGTGRILKPETEISFGPGTIAIHPPRTPHAETSEDGFRNYWLALEQVPGIEASRFIHSDPAGPAFRLMDLLHSESYAAENPEPRIIERLFEALMLFLHREWRDDTHQVDGVVQDLIADMVDHLHDGHYSVTATMERYPVSVRHLRSLFGRQVGRSPHEHLTHLRMERAKGLLQLGFSVTHAARHVGFEDPYYFSRVFRKKVGCCPSDFQPAQ